MPALPRWLLRHRITVEAYRGDSAYGPQYADPVEARALVTGTIKRVRSATGAEVVSTAQVYAAPGLIAPPGSRITLPDGRTTTVISFTAHTAPGLGAPESTEVMCE
ncbi:hypothetical protein [Streptomyces shenzhenensis]|uniref:Head-tail adaptor protein n=1 Tax=Streptomyces shenzhenensis TaxID=943815 RepID=A0A3M0I620_9ACTN|nr:hypothetical protein [Streptomyces shenzhenensis]RMB83650.1 hypothetical protein CTZ28_23315 [Streptomyces shenzhenensis]